MQKGVRKINKELILSELIRSREALDTAIAYVKADTELPSARTAGVRVIRAGEGRAVAILACLRDAGGSMGQREFEETCLKNCRTLVGAGGFIARGSITREIDGSGNALYKLTGKGEETVNRWESRYGKNWKDSIEYEATLGNSGISDHQKIKLMA